jgi:hypothetical protein
VTAAEGSARVAVTLTKAEAAALRALAAKERRPVAQTAAALIAAGLAGRPA